MYLESVELAVERVAFRVLKGGHDIPDKTIERRYFKGLTNLKKFLVIVDEWYLLDNSKSAYSMIGKSLNGNQEIINMKLFKLILNYE